MTIDECKRILEHPIIDAKALCKQADVSYHHVKWKLSNGFWESKRDESQKIEAYLSKWGVEWRDLIKDV